MLDEHFPICWFIAAALRDWPEVFGVTMRECAY
jgi:hypothetical protein